MLPKNFNSCRTLRKCTGSQGEGGGEVGGGEGQKNSDVLQGGDAQANLNMTSNFNLQQPLQLSLNPLSPSICIQILPTDLNTFPYWISWENLIEYQSIFPLVIILLILVTFSLDCVLIMLGENWCLSPLGLKGLTMIGSSKDGKSWLSIFKITNYSWIFMTCTFRVIK